MSDLLFETRGRWGNLPPIADLIDASGDCWEWLGQKEPRGYGMYKLHGTVHMAHRLIWEQLVGPIPEGLTLDHLCRVRSCVNPDHLEVVTRGANVLRGVGPFAMNKRKTECKWGHVYDEANTIILSNGFRQCLACRRRRGLQAITNRRMRAVALAGRTTETCEICGLEFVGLNLHKRLKHQAVSA